MPWQLTGNSGIDSNSNFLGTNDNQPLVIKTNGNEVVRITDGGNVGIAGFDGMEPSTLLHVASRITTGFPPVQQGGAVTFLPPDGFAFFHIDNGPSGRPTGRLRISIGGRPAEHAELVSILQDGKVGIGTTTPQATLSVEGDVEVTGDIRLLGADCAEDFDVSATEEVEPGTVMVIDQDGSLRQSQQAYDKRVAGVISGADAHRPGIILDKQENPLANRMSVALVGKVACKVDAQYGSVEVGDLLTTSSTPGHAMKALDPLEAFGAVIGKALRPLRAGRGLIPILIALQ